MAFKIAYLAPEFPGQTHVFLWREIRALEELGMQLLLLSTRLPAARTIVHDWSAEAQARTSYLSPLWARDFAVIFAELFRAGPRRLSHCLRVAFTGYECGWRERLQLIGMILYAAKLVRILRINGCKHLHVQSCGRAADLAMFASVIAGQPYSLSLLAAGLDHYGPNQEIKWRYARFATVMSDRLLQEVRSRLAGHLPEIVEVVPVGVDLDQVVRRDLFMPWTGKGACEIYSCGRLNPVKGHADLIDAIALLRARGIDCRLTIAGEDEQGGTGYRQILGAHVRAQNAEDHVTLRGALPEIEHRACLEAAAVFVLASYDEGISVAIMEAMAMELPVVVTDVGGNGELVRDGENGLMVAPGNAAALADAIERVLTDPAFAVELGKAARPAVARKFDSRVTAARLLSLIEDSCERLENEKG